MYYPKSPFLRNSLVESQILKGNGILQEQLMSWLCQAPTVTTYRVNLLKTTTSAFKLHLQQLLAKKYETPPPVYELIDLPELVCIGPTALPSPSVDTSRHMHEVMVDACCGAALLRGAHVYAPGVLAMESGTKLGERVQVYADLSGKCKKGTCTRYESPEKVFIGEGLVRMQRHQLYASQAPNGVAVEMESNCSGVPCIGDLSGSEALLQNLPSIVCVRVLGALPGERVLDMCAAPGNKTTHIAEMMLDRGVVYALDKTERKIDCVRRQIESRDLTCVRSFAYDATKAYDGNASANGDGPPFSANSFDRILLDAPCSALGNRPLLTSKLTPKMLESYPNVQRKLFAAAVPLLRSGGVLVYSTCTVTLAENELMVAWALQKFPQLQLVDAVPRFGGPGLPVEGLDEQQRKLVQRFGPSNYNDNKTLNTVGFFIAKFTTK